MNVTTYPMKLKATTTSEIAYILQGIIAGITLANC